MVWLFLPRSVCAPALPDSISLSGSRALDASTPCVLWRGKPLPGPRLLRAWKKGGWIRRLSGLIFERSTLERGVALWISSLRASRVSPTPLRASDVAQQILETSGHTHVECSPTLSPPSSSSRTSALYLDAASTLSLETYKRWVSKLRRHCCARRTSARLIAENGSSSLLWPTAVVTDSKSSGNREITPRVHTETSLTGTSLTDASRLWHTPITVGRAKLPVEVRLWATPTSRDHKGGLLHTKQGRDLATDVEVWVPPSWEAPTDRDGPLYPTPSASSFGTNRGGANGRVGQTRLSLELRASRGLLPGHHDPSTSTAGESTSASSRVSSRVLNPRFVEALQGFPIGWTELTVCEPSVTL